LIEELNVTEYYYHINIGLFRADFFLFYFQESDVLLISDHEEENLDNNIENDTFDDDAGYPQSPDSDIPESTFSNPNRVCE